MSHGLEEYTLEELYDVEENIDKLKYPEKYEAILTLILEKEKSLQASPEYVFAAQCLKDNEEVAEKKYTLFYIFIRVLLWAPFCAFLLTYELETYERIIAIAIFLSLLKVGKNICVAIEVSHLEKQVKTISDSQLGKK
ncbi:MAG: hypothetical protein HRT38_14245 [Alteromonadaceae bacterium]|nr:hypothetical protein [Alteromonadaceae bacterium]